MTNPYLVKIWADAICSVLGDVFLLVVIIGILAIIWYSIKHGDED